MAGGMVGSVAQAALHLKGLSLGLPLAAAGAVGGLWLFALTGLGRTQEQVLLDPKTGQPVRVRKTHTLYFIPPKVWAVIGTVVAVGVVITGFLGDLAERDRQALESKNPALAAAHKAFDQADNNISSYQGSEAFGNTPASRNAASGFAKMLKKLRDEAFEAAKSSSLSTSKGHFITHCQRGADTCLFLVHVPDLRKFDSKAKEVLADLAWMVASVEASKLDPRPANLAVGIRGFALYDRLISGPLAADGSLESAKPEKTDSSPLKEKMYDYFIPVARPQAAPTAPKSEAPAAARDT